MLAGDTRGYGTLRRLWFINGVYDTKILDGRDAAKTLL